MPSKGNRPCDAQNQCDPIWIIAIFISNGLSIMACVWLLCAFRRLLRATQEHFVLRQIWSLALADFVYHASRLVPIAFQLARLLLSSSASDSFLHSPLVEATSWLQPFVTYPMMVVSGLVELQIACYCLAVALRLQTVLDTLPRVIPASWILGFPLGLLCLLWIPLQIQGCAGLLVGIINTTAYALIMCNLCSDGSPGSVQSRSLRRLAIYPFNFMMTYGFVMCTDLGFTQFLGEAAIPLSTACAGLNGLLNIAAYAWQSAHANTLLGTEEARDLPRTPFNVLLKVGGSSEVSIVEPMSFHAKIRATADTSAIEAQEEQSLERAIVLREGGDIMADRLCFSSALVEYDRSETMQQALLASNSAERIVTLTQIGEMHVVLGSFRSALVVYRRVAEMQKSAYGEVSLEFATALHGLGRALSLARCDDQSLLELCMAAQLMKHLSGESSDYAEALRGVGDSHGLLGDFEAAFSCYEEALEIQEKVCGAKSLGYVAVLHSKGKAFLQQGNAAGATATLQLGSEILQRSCRIWLKGTKCYFGGGAKYSYSEELNRPASLLALILRSLGDASAVEGKLRSAMNCYIQCGEIQMKTLGQEAFEMFETKRKIGEVKEALVQREQREGSVCSVNSGRSIGPPENELLAVGFIC